MLDADFVDADNAEHDAADGNVREGDGFTEGLLPAGEAGVDLVVVGRVVPREHGGLARRELRRRGGDDATRCLRERCPRRGGVRQRLDLAASGERRAAPRRRDEQVEGGGVNTRRDGVDLVDCALKRRPRDEGDACVVP